MKAVPTGVGIDVSKATLDVVLRFAERENHFVVPNTSRGLQKLQRSLRECPAPIVMESTGRYHLLAAFRLSQAGYDVRVINPIIARRYLTASVRKNKSDKADAAVLAHVAAIERDIPRFTARLVDIQIRQKIGLVCSVDRQLQSLRAMRQGYREVQKVMSITASDAEGMIDPAVRDLERTKVALETEIADAVTDDEEGRRRRDLAVTIPGFSPYLACLLCQMLRMDCDNPKQWIHYVGLDVTVQQSGRWRGHGKLSKRGNPYLRKRLYCAAWAAMVNHESFRAYYDKLRAEGRSYRETMVIISRKLLRILFAVLKSGTPFSPALCGF